jgi:hypothetical protein
MAAKSYQDDNRLDVLVLGPMDDNAGVTSSTAIIGKAVEMILSEPGTRALLNQTKTVAWNVHIPEEWDEQEIVHGILSQLDIADIVIINLTPKDGPAGCPSPNVYYELGLLHSLGMPVIPVHQAGTELPFYIRSLKTYRVPEFKPEIVANELRKPLLKFLDPVDETDFTDNRISQFYDHLPIVDISAAIGLATGYYYNFVGRLLRDGSFISAYPDKVKRLIIVRPTNVLDTFEQDRERLKTVLANAGFRLVTEKLDAPPGDGKGPAWIDHIDGIIIDLPRTIYPLKISPRLLSMQDRLDKPGGNARQRDIYLRQTSERLLDRVQRAILYHVKKEREGYRKNLLHFAKIDEVPGLLIQFGLTPA